MAFLKNLPPLLLAGALALGHAVAADPAPDADTAWRALQGARPLPKLPPEWEKTPPTDKALIRETLRAESERLLTLAEQARQFAIAYPADTHRAAAQRLAAQALASAEKMGSPTARERMTQLDAERLADPGLPPADRLAIRMQQVQTEAEKIAQNSAADARDKFEEGSRALIHDFPDQPGPWAMLLECVNQGNDPVSLAKLKQIADSQAPRMVRDRAVGILHRYNSLGHPIDLKFTAIDGRAVDLAALRGKVVVVHFWATRCDTCVEGIETMVKAYAALHELGVELIGINLDPKKEKVEQFLKEKGVVWPQFYEPAGEGNRIVREWGMTTLPSMWLIDKNGVLRDLEAQVDLSKKIEAMLGEKAAGTL